MDNQQIISNPNPSDNPKPSKQRIRFSKIAIPWSMITTFLIISSYGMVDRALWKNTYYQHLLNTILTAAIALSQASVDD